ncbi:reverse transcriptase domain-containing protein [Tanacetum coccineum]
MTEHDIENLRARVEAAEQRAETLHVLLGAARTDVRDLIESREADRDCRGTTIAANQRAPVANQRIITCFKCGKQGHYRSECSKLKNQNRENQAGSSEARGRVCALGGGEVDQDPNNITDNVNA